MMFGETYSNSDATQLTCDYTTTATAPAGVSGYMSSQLFASNAGNVSFRPWEDSQYPTSCKTPASLGVPNGPYKY